MRRLMVTLCLLAISIARSAAQSEQPFRFVHTNDTRVTAAGGIEPLKKLIADLKAMSPQPAFIINTGSVTEAGRPQEAGRFLEAASALGIPVYCAPGTRDVRGSAGGKESFAVAFKKLYQSFDKNGVHFVILDSTVLLEPWGHFDSAQIKWLESDLKKLKKDTPVLLFFHHGVGREFAAIDNEEPFLRLIEPYNVAAMFVGSGPADVQWKVNGIDCFTSRGLRQGSCHLVEVGPAAIQVLQIRKEDAGKAPPVIATIPRDRPAGERKHVAFLWDDPDIPLLERRRPLAELRIGKKGAHDEKVTAAYSLNNAAPIPMERDKRDKESVSFMAQFPTKGLPNGANLLRVLLTDPADDVYRRDEPFLVERLTGQPKMAWDDPARCDDAIQASPALDGDTLYVSSLDGKVYAFEAKNGKRRWTAPTKGPLAGSPVVSEGTVYAGSLDHGFYAFDAKTGRQRWRYDAGSALASTPAVANNIVCFVVDNKIIALESATGKEKWTHESTITFHSGAVYSPLLKKEEVGGGSGSTFIFSGSDNALYALDTQTGEQRWRSSARRGPLSAPAVGEGHAVFAADGELCSVNTATGKDDWTVHAPAGGDSFGGATPAYASGVIYCGGQGRNGDVYALNARDGALLWRCSTRAENTDSSPVLLGDRIVIASVHGVVTWIDSKSGKLQHQYNLPPGHCLSTPTGTAQTTYVASMNNSVYALGLPK